MAGDDTTPANAGSASLVKLLIHEGQDGWLFLLAGSNFVSSLYQREGGHLPDGNLRRWRDRALARAKRCASYGITSLFVVVPDKLTVYDHRTTEPLVDAALAPAVRLRQQLDDIGQSGAFLDLVGPMRASRDACDLYWRTDSHWAPEGCFLAYKEICARLRVTPDETLLLRPHVCRHATMDLGWRFDPMRWEVVRVYNYLQNASRVRVNSVTRFLEDPSYEEQVHVGARAWFENPSAPNPQRVLLIGDSYSGQDGRHLTAMMAETFRSVAFVWSAQVDWFALRWLRPDIVIFQIAERFLMASGQDGTSWTMGEWRQVRRARRLLSERTGTAHAR